jgi:hypothetical protein
MPIIVSSGESNQIEVAIRYLDKGSKGIHIFENKEAEEKWIDKSNELTEAKILEIKASGDDVPKDLKKDHKADIKELKTWWRRPDWGTQTKIMKSSQSDSGDTDWTKYRMSQMKSLMVGWNLKTADGEDIPINDTILNKMDYNVALSLLNKYEEEINPTDEELEDLS